VSLSAHRALVAHQGPRRPTGEAASCSCRWPASSRRGGVLLGITKLFWALGGAVGIDPGRLEDRDLWWHLLTLSMGVWSLAGAWGILVLTTRRGFKWYLFP
jgi:hypothetical protein